MTRTWLNFPLRLLMASLLLALILYWQFNFNLAAYYYQEAHTEQYANQNYELALMNYQLSLRYEPENASSFYQSGIVLIYLGQAEAAVQQLEAALDFGFEPRHRALLPLVRVLRSLGRDEEAVAYEIELDESRQR